MGKYEIKDSFEESPHASYRTPRTLLKDAIQRSLGWASETELRDIIFRYTGVRMGLGECNRLSQEIAEIVIKAMIQ